MTQPNLRMLGGFRLVDRDGQEVPVPGKKAQALAQAVRGGVRRKAVEGDPRRTPGNRRTA